MTTPTGREPAEINPARLVDAHRHARAFYRDHLMRADGPRRYLASRGLATVAPGVLGERPTSSARRVIPNRDGQSRRVAG
jgi:hypothetical protein